MSLKGDMSAEIVNRVWKALADPNRRQILDLLADRPRTTGEIVAEFDELCRTAVMKHLDVLVAANLVSVERDGRRRWNRLNRKPLEQICLPWIVQHSRKMHSALDRLKAVVEREPIVLETNPPTSPETRLKKAKSCRT